MPERKSAQKKRLLLQDFKAQVKRYWHEREPYYARMNKYRENPARARRPRKSVEFLARSAAIRAAVAKAYYAFGPKQREKQFLTFHDIDSGSDLAE